MNPSRVFEYISVMDSDKPHWLPIQSLVLKFDQQLHCRPIFSVLPAHCWSYQICDKKFLTVEPDRLCEAMLCLFLVIWYVYLVVFANTDQISNTSPFVISNSNTCTPNFCIQIQIQRQICFGPNPAQEHIQLNISTVERFI